MGLPLKQDRYPALDQFQCFYRKIFRWMTVNSDFRWRLILPKLLIFKKDKMILHKYRSNINKKLKHDSQRLFGSGSFYLRCSTNQAAMFQPCLCMSVSGV